MNDDTDHVQRMMDRVARGERVAWEPRTYRVSRTIIVCRTWRCRLRHWHGWRALWRLLRWES